jgi:hypothetical protein
MQPSRILPDLQCALMCEDVRQEANGNLIIIGVINLIRVPQLPITAGKICFFTRWTAGVGQFVENIRLIAPDQTTVLRKSEVRFPLENAAVNTTNVSVFTQVPFETAGTYYVEILVDDVMKLRFPLQVAVVQPPPGAQQNPAAA